MKKFLLLSILISLLLPPQVFADEWSQDAHDAQRTGYTTEEPAQPWTYVWSWNGANSSGGVSCPNNDPAQGHCYDSPKEARTIMGGGFIFVPAGSRGLYALNKNTGAQAWNVTTTSFNATPAYDAATNAVYAGGSNGILYKINAQNGNIISSYNTGSSIRKAILLVGNYIYVVTDNGRLHKIATSNLASSWVYIDLNATPIDTPPSYSASRDVIVFATRDLYVHAVNNADGTRKWRVKPSPNTANPNAPQTTAGTRIGNQFDLGWPVIADGNGIVLLRMQLDHQAHYEGRDGGRWTGTNADNRAWLTANPQWKNLFALNLDNGTEKFIPVVGYGSTEDFLLTTNSANGVMGSQPVVKKLPDGKEVAYIHFRQLPTAQTFDYRWSGNMGEMVLDNNTISGLVAGDMRFVQLDGTPRIIDEQNPITMGGDILFNNHWAAVEPVKIQDRSSAKGTSSTNPITTSRLTTILRAIKPCGTFSASTHYTSCTGVQFTTDGGSAFNGRSFTGPAFYSYWNVADPPGWRVGSNNQTGNAYSAGFLPRYTYASSGMLVVEGNGGDLMVFRHSGSTTQPTTIPSSTPGGPPSTCIADINGDLVVDLTDYSLLVQNFLKSPLLNAKADLSGDGIVDLTDYSILVNRFLKPCN